MPTASELRASIAAEKVTQTQLKEDIRSLKKLKDRKDAPAASEKSDVVAELETELSTLQSETSNLQTEKSDLETELGL
jgi:septal ring factor EnvC (AmiA/AmiB activator)